MLRARASNTCSRPPRWNPISILRRRRHVVRQGLFQFIEQTWLGTVKEAGPALGYNGYADAITKSQSGDYSVADPATRAAILKLRDDPTIASAMAGVLTQSNSFKLTGLIGRRPTDSELYMAHFMGVGGAAKLIANAQDNPQASGARLFPNAAAANRPIFYDRDGRARSVSEVYADLDQRYAIAAGSPATRRAMTSETPVAAASDQAAYLSRLPDVRGVTPIATSSSAPPSQPAFRSLFQVGERTQPVSPAVQELWGSCGPPRADLIQFRSASAVRSVQRPQRHLQRLAHSWRTVPARVFIGMCRTTKRTPTSRQCRSNASPHVRVTRCINETSTKTNGYGEPFVKRRGLFSMTVAPRHGVVSGCVGRKHHDVRQFISWVRTAPAGERAEATRALARAWLISDLSDDDRAAAEGGLLMQLDDPSPLVRRAMAEVFARSATAPAAIVQALSVDQPSVAISVLEHSPLLIDADLVDIVATGSCDVQCAVARRACVPVSICAAIAEVGSAAAALELIENPGADLAPLSWARIVERHGHLAAIRESMLALDDLPAATRLALVAKLSDTLAQFVVARNWLNADRAGRAASDARDRSIVNIAARARDDDMRGLVAHLRATGQLTAGLILRALLSGNLDLFDHALVELSGLPLSRVAALVHDRGGASRPRC